MPHKILGPSHAPAPNGLLLHFLPVLLPRPRSRSGSQSRGGKLQKGLGFPQQGPSTGRAAGEQEGEQMRSVPRG